MYMKCIQCNQTITGYGKKFCSRSCSVSYNNALNPKRQRLSMTPCIVCDKKCSKRTCSYECNRRRVYLEYIDSWKEGKESGGTVNGVSAYVRKYLLETRGEQCEICGWREVHRVTHKVPLEVHHLGDHNDHSESNLMLLCPNHHALTDSYRGLNRGNGRVHRRSTLADVS